MRHRPASVAVVLLATVATCTAALAAEPPPHLVTVAGRGEVRAAPDRATVTLGVVARAPTVEPARTEANRVVAALLAVARGLKIADADVHATRLTVSPEYDFGDGKRPRRMVGYTVQREVVVELRDIDRLGDLIEKGLAAGANLATDAVLDSSRRADLEREALARAVADARANAAVIAQALDAGVGVVRAVTQGGASEAPPRLFLQSLARPSAAGGGETYQPGELTFAATVTASFDLIPAAVAR